MDHSFLAITLLALATVLIVAEIFIPSAGMLAIGMLVTLAASFYFAWSAWSAQPLIFLGFVGFAILFLPGVAIAALSWLPHTRFGKRILLEAPTEQEVLPFAREEQRLRAMIGKQARTLTPLTPGGLITFNHERIHAFSEGVIIERDMPVEIIKVSGTRVVVREFIPSATADDTPSESDSQAEQEKLRAENPLDFELPEV